MSFRKIYAAQVNLTPSKSTSRNTTPKRESSKQDMKKKELVPTPPSYPKSAGPRRRTIKQENKENSKTFMINLEDLLILEDDLHFLIENLRITSDSMQACEE